MNDILNSIKNLLQQGEIENALSQLIEITQEYSSRYHNEIILHTANFKQLESDKRKGILSIDETRREKTRILNAILDLISEIDQEIANRNTVINPPQINNTVIDNSSNSKTPSKNVTSTVDSPENNQSIEVFVSYSHKDENLREELDIHLANLKRQRKITAWNDRAIEAGTEWDAEIKAHLASSRIVLLLITPRFMASEYCYDKEMQQAMERHKAGTARVIPIILKPTDWKHTPFSKLQVLPRDAKPITTWDNPDFSRDL